MRQQIAAANWKMNLTWEQGQQLLKGILDANVTPKQNQAVIIAVPFPYLTAAKEIVEKKAGYFVAAQNCYHKKSGAFTGEVSAEMLKSIGVKYVIIGHSERREYFNETNQQLADKLNLLLENGIVPVFCCGEPLAVREANEQNSYVEQQLVESLFHLTPEQISGIVIAYEPIWAIGTGKTATADQAQEIQAYLRSVLAGKYGKEVAAKIPVLYGGSVKAANAKEIFSNEDVDGGLVGGASLQADEFVKIIEGLK
ncbi:triose-phosphate isomerase [Pinibacter aurantiacus]|uniref:Triosephosphate isomerase n=1 Tax=Pinibacter aurantiacus TaxID=2851599 RepID=A0A9E2S2T4_9BACT|nr:triose-phosphate isomerase [Pinibacter aurantiacus]MBV4355568.1 triose-phosphate isomerase [Pinibacter aurantiacus]